MVGYTLTMGQANNNIPVPEWRLPLPMIGGIIFAAGLFWFGWGGYMPTTPWIVPTLAGLFIGFGIFTVFLQCLNYIIDAYRTQSFRTMVVYVLTLRKSCLPRQLLQRTPFCVPCLERSSRYLR